MRLVVLCLCVWNVEDNTREEETRSDEREVLTSEALGPSWTAQDVKQVQDEMWLKKHGPAVAS